VRKVRKVRKVREAVACAVVALSAAVPLRAQETVLYRLIQRGSEVGRETVRLLRDGYELSVVVPLLQMRMDSRTTLDANGHVARFTARLMPPAGDSVRADWVATADGDTVRVVVTRAGQTHQLSIPGRADFVIPAQTIAIIALAADRANGRDTTFRALAMGVDTAMALPVHFRGDSLFVNLGPLEVRGRRGRWPVLDVPMSQVRGEPWNGRDTLPPLSGMHRPNADYSAPADAPYTAEGVRVPERLASGDTFSLGCTLTKPKAGGPRFPVVATATGSGQEDRDENLWPLVPDYRPFRDIAVRLARAGIAVLRCDDRGFGTSGGDVTHATTEDFAADVHAQLTWLRARPDINPRRTAVLGHSEGGLIGPMVAASDPQLAAVVVMAGTAKPGRDVLHYQIVERGLADTTLRTANRDSLRSALEQQVAAMIGTNAWTRFFADYDPSVTARRVRQPVLIVQGALDRQVTAGQADTLAAAMRAGGNRDVTVRLFPGLNHLFLVSPSGTGDPAEYATLREVTLPQDVLDTIATWLAAKLGR